MAWDLHQTMGRLGQHFDIYIYIHIQIHIYIYRAALPKPTESALFRMVVDCFWLQIVFALKVLAGSTAKCQKCACCLYLCFGHGKIKLKPYTYK